jgi:hypothetical protein
MNSRSNDGDALIELLEDRTRLNLRGLAPPPPRKAPAEAPRPSRRNRRRHVEYTAMGNEASSNVGEFPCPSCGAPGQLDIREGASGRCYLSCTSCFKMWQEVREPDTALQLTAEELWQMR